MLIILYMGLENSIRGKTLWKIACLILIWIIWWERNVRIFEDKWRMLGMLWDLLHFFSSFLAYVLTNLKKFPLNVIQLNWHLMCTPIELDHHWKELSLVWGVVICVYPFVIYLFTYISLYSGLWTIWKERNRRAFNDIERFDQTIKSIFMYTFVIWTRVFIEDHMLSLINFVDWFFVR